MVMAGYSPSVRLFEAAACGAAIVSDNWPGLDLFLEPGREILLPATASEIVHYLRDLDDSELRAIGMAAQRRVLAAHTSQQRANEFEREVEAARRGQPRATRSTPRPFANPAVHHSKAAAKTCESRPGISL